MKTFKALIIIMMLSVASIASIANAQPHNHPGRYVSRIHHAPVYRAPIHHAPVYGGYHRYVDNTNKYLAYGVFQTAVNTVYQMNRDNQQQENFRQQMSFQQQQSAVQNQQNWKMIEQSKRIEQLEKELYILELERRLAK